MAVTWRKLAYEDDVVTKALFDADTFLYASSNDTPVATSPANVMAALSGHAAAEFSFNTQKIGGVVDPTTAQQAATKKYVDDQVATADTFVELTDTPANYTSAAGKLVVVNATPNALEFVAITTFLEDSPSNDETSKAPTSNWAYDHGVLKSANAVLGHVMVESASLIDVDGNGKLTLGAHAATHKDGQSDEILLHELGEPTGAVAIAGQQMTDMVLENSADPPATAVVGKIYFDTDLSAYICTDSTA